SRAGVKIGLRQDNLVTIGIRPNYPETGYGYIMKGKSLGSKPAAYRVKRFREKPSMSLAQQLIRQGSLWNSGIFVWKAATILELMRSYQPTISQGLERIKKVTGGRLLVAPTPQIRSCVTLEHIQMHKVS